jgi:GTP-binding protein HflX
VELKRRDGRWRVEDSLAELAQLARTAGVEVVGSTYQRVRSPHPAYYIGRGKLQELEGERDLLGYDMLIFDDELLPRQQRNLEEALEVKVLDRTALILDIFAKHARTKEGQLQVELAQYEYRLPRLTRMWAHLSRQTVGGVGLRGPGETQLEVDRREMRRRIARLRGQLEEVRRHRQLYRRRRRRAGIPVVAIVGYTNAGKSSLLNAIAGSSVLVEDALFATLDPTTRRVTLPGGSEVLFTDTVGFIQKLPPTVVAAFRATLEEVREADLLVHVLDITHELAHEQRQTVQDILGELGVDERPTVLALNKIDLLEDLQPVEEMASAHPNSVAISAREGIGLEALLQVVEEALNRSLAPVRVEIPYANQELVSLFHRGGIVEEEEHGEAGTRIRGRVPLRMLHRLREYIV